jgi:hypothetical protein
VEKVCTADQVTDGNIIRHMCIACWVPKAKNTPLKCVILIVFLYSNHGIKISSQWYVIPTLPVSFLIAIKFSTFP